MAIDRGWMKAFGFTSRILNRNFFIGVLMLSLSLNVFQFSKYFEMQSKLETEKNLRISDKEAFSANIERHEAEKRDIMYQFNLYIMELVDKYEKRLDEIIYKYKQKQDE